MNPIVDMPNEEWIAYRNELNTQVQSIHITNDINPKMAIVILSRIDSIYSHLRIHFSELESSKERIDLMIKEIERAGLEGRNEDERKRNAVLQVRRVSTENGFTLYDMQRESTQRYMYIKGVLDVLTQKQSRLITINGLLKLDKDLLVSTDSYQSAYAHSN